jgi:hypothetical protein
MKIVIMISVIMLLLCAAPLFAAAPNMQEGNWEIVTAIKIEGVPFSMPPIKVTQCFTKKDLEDSAKTRPSSSNDCEVKDLKETASAATWKIVCKDGITGTGEASYKGGTYTATMTMAGKDSGNITTIRPSVSAIASKSVYTKKRAYALQHPCRHLL